MEVLYGLCKPLHQLQILLEPIAKSRPPSSLREAPSHPERAHIRCGFLRTPTSDVGDSETKRKPGRRLKAHSGLFPPVPPQYHVGYTAKRWVRGIAQAVLRGSVLTPPPHCSKNFRTFDRPLCVVIKRRGLHSCPMVRVPSRFVLLSVGQQDRFLN